MRRRLGVGRGGPVGEAGLGMAAPCTPGAAVEQVKQAFRPQPPRRPGGSRRTGPLRRLPARCRVQTLRWGGARLGRLASCPGRRREPGLQSCLVRRHCHQARWARRCRHCHQA